MEKTYRILEWPESVPDIIRLLQTECNRLKIFRVAKGWSQAQVAEFFGVNVRTWNCWERGAYAIPGPMARSVALEVAKCLPDQKTT
jgi:DNA-binding XRE family transcriptional regulator